MLGADLLRPLLPNSSRVSGMTVIVLPGLLVASEPNLLGVDDDDVIAGVEKRGVDGLPFAGQDSGDAARQTSEDLALGVHDVPVVLNVCFLDKRR